MEISLTAQQIDSIIVSELNARLAVCDDASLASALKIVLEAVEGKDDELQDIVSETAC